MKDATTGFIVGQIGGPIYGFGASETEAREMARKWISGSPVIRPYITGQMVVGDMFIAPATQALLDLVKEVGGDVGYQIIDGVAYAADGDSGLEKT